MFHFFIGNITGLGALRNHSFGHVFKQISTSLAGEGGSTLNMSGTIAWAGVLDWVDEREEGARGEQTFLSHAALSTIEWAERNK